MELDAKRRELIFEAESLKAQQNEVSRRIPQMKKAGEDTAPVFEEMKKLSDTVKELDSKTAEIDSKMNEYVYGKIGRAHV